MISASLSIATHMLVSSFRILTPLGQVLEFVWPLYRNMASKAVKGKVNFNTKHLSKGDALPPYNGKLRVYNMRYCPYAQRTILALNAKNIDYEVVNINLKDKPEWFFAKSPLGKVPSIEYKENETIYESLITVEYLDDVYPQRPLLPKDPVKKALDKIIVERANAIHTIFYKFVRGEEPSDEVRAAFRDALTFVQDQLKSRNTSFLDGSEPGYADYMIWPWFERILQLADQFEPVRIDKTEYKLLLEYFDRMLKDPAVSQYLVPKEVLAKILEGYKPGNTPNYNLLLEE